MLSLSPRRWLALAIALPLLAVAVGLTIRDVRLASSQTVTLVAKRSEEPVPLDNPSAGVWDRAAAVEVPLSAQNVVPPMAGGEGAVKARALHDGHLLYIRVEWKDDTEDTLASRVTEFTDAAAVQFPVIGGQQVPAFCMGDPNAPVNIWQWKAAWQTDVVEGPVSLEDTYPNMAVDLYPFEDEEVFYPPLAAGNVPARAARTSAADNLLAGSFGTLTPADDQVVDGHGEWRDGRWRVVFARDLSMDGDYAQFAEGERTDVAFAVWNGAKGERDGMKSVSQFLALEVSPEVATAAGGGLSREDVRLIVVIGLGVAVAAAVAFLGYRRWRAA